SRHSGHSVDFPKPAARSQSDSVSDWLLYERQGSAVSPVSPRQLYVRNTFDRRQHRLDHISDCLAVRMHPAYADGQSAVPELDDRP
ncbi:hypothetical protein, partial [Sphingomonas sp. GC_Shp_3]|uniref:hypothetical protein n=1 Tax=Sphingomonas sp. GC_Shp_3 TaxID=2937383 RepID=UPI00226A30BC